MESNSEVAVNPEVASLSQLIAEFKSNLESQNISLQGKLTFTLGGASHVDVKFQRLEPEQNNPLITDSSKAVKSIRENVRFHAPVYETPADHLFLPQSQKMSNVHENQIEIECSEPKTTSSHVQSFASFTLGSFRSSLKYSNILLPAPSTSSQRTVDEGLSIFQRNESLNGITDLRASNSAAQNQDKFFVESDFMDSEQLKFVKCEMPQEKISLIKYSNILSDCRSSKDSLNHTFISKSDISDSVYIPELSQQVSREQNLTMQPIFKNNHIANNLTSLSSIADAFLKNSFDSSGIFSNNIGKIPLSCNKLVSASSKKINIGTSEISPLKTAFNEDMIYSSVLSDCKTSKETELCTSESQLDSSNKDTKHEIPMIQTEQSLQKNSIDVYNLEHFSHRELVTMLIQVLHGKGNTALLPILSNDDRLLNKQKKNKKKRSTFQKSANREDLSSTSPVKNTGLSRKSQTNRTKLVSRQSHDSGLHYKSNSQSQSFKPAFKKKQDNIVPVQMKENPVTSPRVKKKSSHSVVIKSSMASQPLRKRKKTSRSPINDYANDFDLKNESDTSQPNVQMQEDEKCNVKKKSQSSYTCKQCSKIFSNKLMYRRHVRSHVTGFQCDVCGKTLKTKDSLYHHQRGLHTKNKPYACKLCSLTFSFHHSFKLHLQRHKGERPHRCSLCHKTYLTSNHLKVHVEAAHGVGSIVCHICGKTFSYNCTLKQHLLKHTGERPYSCSLCEKSFITKQSLRAHTASHNESKNQPCEICGKVYKSEHSKNVHMKRHGKQVRTFMCELCGKAFFFKSNLKSHIYTHSKTRPHSCPQCGKAFKSKASLYTHKFVHRESQPFVCTICGKTFKAKNCCAAHVKRHENGKSFTCSQCGSIFPDKGGLSKHMKTIHIPKKHFTCTICGKKGTRGDNMRTHVKSHKNEKTSNPMDYIIEEVISESDVMQGLVQVKPRLRGLRQRNSKRLGSKDSSVSYEEKCITPYSKVKASGTTQIKSEALTMSTLQLTDPVVPVFKSQLYSSQVTFMTDEPNNHQSVVHPSLTILFHDQHHQDQQEHIKTHYYPAYLQPDVSGTSNNPALSLGPMTSLLSAINPSEHDTASGNISAYQNILTPPHTSLSVDSENQRVEPTIYSNSLQIQGSLSQLHQILTRTNDSVLTDHHRAILIGQCQNQLNY